MRDCTQAVPSRRRNLRRVRHVMPCARRNPSTRCNLRCASSAAQPPRETATTRRRRLRRLVSVGQPRRARRGRRSRRRGVSFAGQLPSSDHRAIFVTRDSGRVARQVPRNYPAATHSTLAFAWDNRHPYHGDVFFPAQLPGGVHRPLFFAQDYGRVVVQLPHNYPAAAHFALFLMGDGRHRLHFDTFFAQQLPGGVHPAVFFARDYGRVVG